MKIYYKSLITIVLFSFTAFAFLFMFGGDSGFIKITPFAILEVNENSSEALQQYTNMRFASRIITYSINSSCSLDEVLRIKSAFNTLENRTQIVHFNETTNGRISILCNNTKNRNGRDHIKLGEGGINEVVKIDKLHIINKGQITFFRNENRCDTPNVESHEILHVLGFKHSNNTQSIMYNLSSCNQNITNNIIKELRRLYSVPELPDLKIEKVEFQKNRRTVDLDINIINQGLKDSENITLRILSRTRGIAEFKIGNLPYGAGKRIRITNLNPKRSKYLKIEISGGIEIDLSNNFKEINF